MTCCQNTVASGVCNKPAEGAASCPFVVYLANLAVWNVKLHNLHWNVVGRAFVQVHEFTESLYDEVNEQFDAVAEACKMRGKFPPVKLSEYLAMATIEEVEARDYPVSEVIEMVEADMKLMRDLALEIRKNAAEADDFQVQALMEGYLEGYAKQLWFLRAMKEDCCCKSE